MGKLSLCGSGVFHEDELNFFLFPIFFPSQILRSAFFLVGLERFYQFLASNVRRASLLRIKNSFFLLISSTKQEEVA